MNGTKAVIALALCGAVAGMTPVSGQQPLPVSTPVRSVSAPRPSATASVVASPFMQTAPMPTLPGQRMPQYDVSANTSSKFADYAGGRVRLVIIEPSIVAAVKRPVIVEMNISIDGVPFGDLRHQRTDESLVASQKDAQASLDKPNAEVGPDDSEEVAAPAKRLSSTPYQKYLAATGEPLSSEEARWLASQWVDGPPLLVLQPVFQSFRSNQRPAFDVLDRDGDKAVSAAEVAKAAESFLLCDANRDDVVESLEIFRRAEALRPPAEPGMTPQPLFVLASDLAGTTRDVESWFDTLATLDQDHNGTIDTAEAAAVTSANADLTLDVQFNTNVDEGSQLILQQAAVALNATVEADVSTEGITVRFGTAALNLTAVQSSGADQVSLGAVVDGYPLLPFLDPNDDGRLTIRERRELPARLAAFDADNDGSIRLDEAIAPVRISIGLGPVVHTTLASIRKPIVESRDPSDPGPEWFVRMDRNGDHDLGRGEFPGTDEQFAQLDKDGDKLISALEARTADAEREP